MPTEMTVALASAEIVLCSVLAADWSWSEAFGTPAFRAARPLSFPVSDRDFPARNALAQRVNFPSRWKAAWSILSRRRLRRHQAKRLFRANRVSLACLASTCPRARVPPALRAPCPVPIMPFPGGTRPRHFRAAIWFAPETPLPLPPIGKRPRTLHPAPGEPPAHPVAALGLHETLSRR